MDDWRIEPLDATHDRGSFHCGKPSLDEFLRSLSSQYEKRKLGRTFVGVLPTEKKVHGYYTLAAGALPVQVLPPRAARKLPRHPVPVALLGRLAVDQGAQGRRLGAMLLYDALNRCVALSRSAGVYAVEVTAIDESARNFYSKYGFTPLQDGDLHLYLPISTIEKTLA